MATPSQADLRALLLQQRPTTFLTLAPATSASYPVNPALKTSSATQITEMTSPASLTQSRTESPAVTGAPVLPVVLRRSSSLSSDGTGSAQKKRFLKLGPVHHGENYGSGDWSEEVIAE